MWLPMDLFQSAARMRRSSPDLPRQPRSAVRQQRRKDDGRGRRREGSVGRFDGAFTGAAPRPALPVSYSPSSGSEAVTVYVSLRT